MRINKGKQTENSTYPFFIFVDIILLLYFFVSVFFFSGGMANFKPHFHMHTF